ncbi:MAG TPA: hypothetical protein VMW38_25535, partial [Terriglobia bacterium]|nr:hypothetical protein [Terriglobia bacterium]
LSGNPLAVTAGITTLKILKRPGTYESLERLSGMLSDGMVAAAKGAEIPVWANRVGSMFTLFFSSEWGEPTGSTPPSQKGIPVTDWQSAGQSNTRRFAVFFQEMLKRGVYLAPSQFEAGFLSTAHTERDLQKTVEAAGEAFAVAARIA